MSNQSQDPHALHHHTPTFYGRITGLTFSILIHVVLLLLLGTLVVLPAKKQEQNEVEAFVNNQKIIYPDDPVEIPNPTEEEFSDIDAPTLNNLDTSLKSPAPTPVDVGDMFIESIPDINVTLPNLPNGQFAANISGSILSGLRGKKSREELTVKYNTHQARLTERAVDRALSWLASHQNSDGSWGKNETLKPAQTSLSLMCFLGRGVTPCSARYGQTTLDAIKWLVRRVEEMDRQKKPYIGNGRSYNHPLVCYALSEAYALTGMPKIRNAMNIAMKKVVDGMNVKGGYNYQYEKRLRYPIPRRDEMTGKYPEGDLRPTEPHCDLSFAGWNYQALKAGFLAGCDLNGLESALKQARIGLKHHFNKGGFCLNPEGSPDFTMTCVGVLCLGMLGEGKSKEAQKGFDWLMKFNENAVKTCSWKYQKKIHEKNPFSFAFAMYNWYYQVQLLMQVTKGRGSIWNRWNDTFTTAAIREQYDDGHWSTPAMKYGEGKIPEQSAAEWTRTREFRDELDLNIYATSICCLSLEVYYRYLPTFKLGKRQERESASLSDDDLGIMIE